MAKRFRLDACKKKPPPEPPMKIPRASEVNTNAVLDIPPPTALLERQGNPPIIIGLDIVRALELDIISHSAGPLYMLGVHSP